jgi:hypothetical protein
MISNKAKKQIDTWVAKYPAGRKRRRYFLIITHYRTWIFSQPINTLFEFPKSIKQYDDLLTDNRIWKQRLVNIGKN